ncbi:MAG: FHA domain-containing protein [Ilumatobacter sp.]
MDPTLVLPDGRRVEIDGDLVLGRAPIAPESSPSARSISLSAATISKTHVLIGHDADGVWLVDLNSSNGTEVVDAVGTSESAVPGQRLAVPPGSHIRVGTGTIITVETAVGSSRDPIDDDLDRTVSVRPHVPGPTPEPDDPPVVPAARPGGTVDWSSVTDPDPAPVAVAEPAVPSWASQQPPSAQPPSAQPPSSPVQPAFTSQPPPPVEPPPPSQPPPPVAPVTAYLDRAAPQPPAFDGGPLPVGAPAGSPHGGFPHGGFPPSAAPRSGFPSATFPSSASASASAPASAGGRSSAHVIGAIVIAVWSAVVFLEIREWIPDSLVRAIDGRVIDFFLAPGRDELRFQEYFSLITLPDGLGFLSWAAEIGPLVAVAGAIAALVVPRSTVRWIVVALVAIPTVLNIGVLVSLGFIEFSILTDNIDRFVPWFVLPFVGSLLLLWPSRRSAAGPSPQPGVFYDLEQPSAPWPPGPGASPFS